jgi:glucose-1-phosphate cytidylyltransferase
MKVVLFCGGLGMRLRDYADNIPKPMVPLGYRPIIWHVMKYYAHYGHKDFILCLGYRGDLIKQYFLDYEECLSNDFVLSEGGRRRELANSDIEDWRITFAETGLSSNIGERLKAVQPYLEGDDMFLANYSDAVTDLPLPQAIEEARKRDVVATFASVKPNISYHFVSTGSDGIVKNIHDIVQSGLRVNGGYFVFKKQIFDYMNAGEELVLAPFDRLIAARQLFAYEYDGFWMPMDTAKDKKRLDELVESGSPPWHIWNRSETKRRLTLSNRRIELSPSAIPSGL